MSRSQFQRLAVVTIVVLLATIASNRLMAYASTTYHAHHEAISPMEHRITIDTHVARESCIIQAHVEERIEETRAHSERARTMAQVQRDVARAQREMARAERERAREVRQMTVELQAAAREVEREVLREVRNLRIEVR